MTSLIDVIFLLLLFFMLSSTFSTFAEVELSAAGGGGTAEGAPLFVQLGPDSLRLNGTPLDLAALDSSALAARETPVAVIVSLGDGVSAQRLTDLLVALRPYPALAVTVLEG